MKADYPVINLSHETWHHSQRISVRVVRATPTLNGRPKQRQHMFLCVCLGRIMDGSTCASRSGWCTKRCNPIRICPFLSPLSPDYVIVLLLEGGGGALVPASRGNRFRRSEDGGLLQIHR